MLFRKNIDVDSAESSILISGWLYKQKHSKPKIGFKWNKRWFLIESGCLSWYHRKKGSVDKKIFPSGCIRLDDILRVYKIAKVTEKELNVFVVKSKKRSLCLSTKTSGDCDKWVKAIQMQMDLRSGGTVSGPKSAKNSRVSNGGGDNLDVSSINFIFTFLWRK